MKRDLERIPCFSVHSFDSTGELLLYSGDDSRHARPGKEAYTACLLGNLSVRSGGTDSSGSVVVKASAVSGVG